MTPWTERQNLPDALVEALGDLDAPAVRAVRAHVEQRLGDLRPTLSDVIRSKTGSEVVDITDSGPYALVRKYRASGDSSGAGQRTRSLYRGAREKQLNGEESLHWSYLEDVAEPAGVECEGCGIPLGDSTTARPHCGEELSRDGGRDSMERPPTARRVPLLAGGGVLGSVTNPNLSIVAPTDTDTGDS